LGDSNKQYMISSCGVLGYWLCWNSIPRSICICNKL